MNAIYKFVLGMIGKRSGVVTTLPNQKQIEFQANMLAEKFMQNGIDPNALKSPEQVKNVLANIDQANMRVIPADSAEGASISRGLGIGKKADVMDMEGNKIDTSKGIMGGKQIQPINMTVEERTGGLLKGKYESDEAIKARLVADNKKGIKSIKINLVDDSIAKIKSLEPIEAMKEANLVAGKKGRYANLDDNQVKKIMDDTQEHIFQDSSPLDDYATGGRVGLFMGSAYPKGAAALREMLKLFGKKSDSVKNPSDILRIVNPKQFNKTLEDPSIYRKFDVEKGIGAPDMIRNIQKKMTSDRQSTVKEMLDAAKNIKKSDDATLKYKNEMIEEMMNKGASREMAEEMAETISKMAENAAGKSNTPKLTDEGLLQLENILKNMETGGKKPRDLNADGGRIGLKGGMNKRTFLKLMGSVGASIGAAKSGIFSFGKGAGKEVAKEVVQKSTTTPPPYFFKLAEKIKMMGDDATATTDRTIAKTLKSKDGKSTYLLEEDITSGDTIIKKINKEGDEMITDVEIMELKKGEVVMGKDGKPIKVPDEYEEVTEANARIEGDTFNDPYYSDGIQVDEIIKEVDDTVPSIKYASGGLAYMLGE